jgi:tRNA(Ile)-lysidine synthase TilS/MesJ
MINKYIKQEYIQSKHTCTCITELNKINMTKIKGLHRFQNSFPEIHDVACNKLTNIDRKAYYNILEAFNKLALSAHLGHSCETG